MSLAHPKTCDLGKTYFDAPDFFAIDFSGNSGGDFTDPDELVMGADFPVNYSWKDVNPDDLSVTALFAVSETGLTTVSGLLAAGGVALGKVAGSQDPAAANMSGVSFYTAQGDNLPHFVIYDGASVIWTSDPLVLETSYAATVTFTLTPSGVGSSYDLTVDLLVPSIGISESFTFVGWALHSVLSVPFVSAGAVSNGSQMILTRAYMVGYGFPRTCRGPVPSASEVLRDSTGKITHAGIYRMTGSDAVAAQLHNEFKAAT